MNKLGILEGILFVSGDEGITLSGISDILGLDIEEIKNLLKDLRSTYETDDRGMRITFLGDAFKLTTKPEHKEYYRKMVENPEVNGLSPAALETLAIMAYNQPLTRAEVDELRGVSTGQMIRKLVAKGFLKESGKATTLGRPNLYKTTSYFLDYFGLATLDDLPQNSNMNNEISDETDLFKSIYKDINEE